VIGLDTALDRLLHRRSYREAFLAGRLDALDLSAEDREALTTIDPDALVREAASVQQDLLRREHRGCGGLLSLYPRTIAAWREAHPSDPDLVELLSRFMESDAFDAYREIPFAGQGLSLEEAFHRFCEAEEVGSPEAREEELLTATMKALLSSPHPDFSLPAAVLEAEGGFFAVGRHGGPKLYAAVSGRLLIGALTPFLAELLLSSDSPEEIARRHGVAPAICDASLAQLGALGLLPRVPSRCEAGPRLLDEWAMRG
jgi:hypothetical protein